MRTYRSSSHRVQEMQVSVFLTTDVYIYLHRQYLKFLATLLMGSDRWHILLLSQVRNPVIVHRLQDERLCLANQQFFPARFIFSYVRQIIFAIQFPLKSILLMLEQSLCVNKRFGYIFNRYIS